MLQFDTLTTNDQEAGIFTWLIGNDRLYGDTSIASIFGLDPAKTLRGLPLEVYLDRVHDDDRPQLAQAISEAVQNGTAYHAEYRVKNAWGQFVMVMGMGRCFRDEHGTPSFYSGITYPIHLL